jgi:hypothetical protein
MKTTLDGVPIESSGGVAGAIEAARLAAERRGRIVIDVLADGSPMPGALLDAPPADDAGLAELAFTSAPPGVFIRETLLDALPALGECRTDQQRAAEMLHRGELAGAMEPLKRVLEGWAVVRELADKSLELLGLTPAHIAVPADAGATPTDGAACAAELAACLQRVREAVRGEDWGALADELAYDMDAQAGRWGVFLGAIADRAVQDDPPRA